MEQPEMLITKTQQRAKALMENIEKLCIESGMNMTIYEGKIGFADQAEDKIVLLWSPSYKKGE